MDNFSNLEIIIKIKAGLATDKNETWNVIDDLIINKGDPNRLYFFTLKLSLTMAFQQKQE